MAVKVLTPVKGELNTVTPFALETATAAADGFEFTMPKITEEYVVIIAHNSGAAAGDLTIKKPVNGSYAAAGADETVEIAAGGYAQIRIESARFADTKGIVRLVGETADIKVEVLY